MRILSAVAQLFLLREKRENKHSAYNSIRESHVFFCFMGFLKAVCCGFVEFSIDNCFGE